MEFGQFAASTRRPRDVPWRFPKGPDVRYLQGTFRGLLADQQKKEWFYEKKCFLDAIVFVLHIYYFFLVEKQKLFKSSLWESPLDVYGTQLQDVLGTK